MVEKEKKERERKRGREGEYFPSDRQLLSDLLSLRPSAFQLIRNPLW